MPTLVILPGTLSVLFLIHVASVKAALAVAPGRFLEGLRADCDALSFGELRREDERPEDLLPWAGNV